MTKPRFLATALLPLMGLAIPSALAAESRLPDRFVLGQYIPETCCFFADQAHNPERAMIEEHWQGVWDRLQQMRLDQEVRAILLEAIPKEDRDQFDQFWDRTVTLAEQVDWSTMVEEELAVGLRMTPLPSVVVLMRGQPGSGERNRPALVALAEHFATLVPTAKPTHASEGPLETCSVVFPGAPIGIEVFGKGDIIGVSTCCLLAGEVKARLANPGTKPSIVTSPRFRAGLAKLPPPQDGVAILDWHMLIEGTRKLFGIAVHHQSSNPKPDQGLTVVHAIDRLLERFNILDYTITVQWTEGRHERWVALTKLLPDARESQLARIKVDRPPLKDPFRYVPKEARTFTASAGIDWQQLYNTVVEAVREDVPGGEDAIDAFETWQTDFGFDIDRDLFSWISGEMINVTLPTATPTPFAPEDGVLFIRVSDAGLARQKLQAGLERIQALAQEHINQPVITAPATGVQAEGFQIVSFPLFALLPRPMIGVHDDWLIVGTSPDAINLCLATAAGNHPTILESPRFRREGMKPGGPVQSVSFMDLSSYGESMAGAFIGMGFMAGMMPNDEEARPAKRALGSLARLQSVFSGIDFLSSSSTVTIFEGDAWRSEGVVTYVEPQSADSALTAK